MGFREKIYVEYDRIRLRCKCGKVFTLLPEGVAPRIRVTNRMMDQILLFLRNSSFREVATICGLSPKTVKGYLLRKVDTSVDWEHFRDNPVVSISIDEHRQMRGKEVLMVVENTRGMPVALLPSSRKEELKGFLERIPEWLRVREFVIDMRRSYFYAIKEIFSCVPVVVDKFHVLRDAVRRLECLKRVAEDAIRRYEGRRETFPLYLLRKRYRDLTWRQRVRLRVFLGRYPQLKLLYWCKERLWSVYEARDRVEASYRLDILLRILRGARMNRDAQEWLRTLTRWREERLNYFLYRSTNARIESFTGQAKLVQRVSCGLRNEEVYKRKVLLRGVPYNALSHLLL